jgi:hypothetical protein
MVKINVKLLNSVLLQASGVTVVSMIMLFFYMQGYERGFQDCENIRQQTYYELIIGKWSDGETANQKKIIKFCRKK